MPNPATEIPDIIATTSDRGLHKKPQHGNKPKAQAGLARGTVPGAGAARENLVAGPGRVKGRYAVA
ncbi:hypothetical protein JOD67_007365 [Tenggerimyces flavus]|nr:hypothetical protein [Tenggerimyces flavus]